MRQAKRYTPTAYYLALGWLSAVVLTALFVQWLPLPFTPAAVDLYAVSQPPMTGKHWLGTDTYGRDVLAMLLYGARTVLLVSAPAAIASTVLGILLGSAAGFWGNYRLQFTVRHYGLAAAGVGLLLGYYSSWPIGLIGVVASLVLWLLAKRWPTARWALPVDSAVLGAIVTVTSIPRLILVLTLAAIQQPSVVSLLLILLLTYWVTPAQLVRAEMLRIRELSYIEAAQAMGLSSIRVLVRHALPNACRSAITAFPLSIASLIGLETTLSFLGIGLPPTVASWGRVLAAAQLEPSNWWLIVFPGLLLLFTTLSLRQVSKQLTTWYATRFR